MNLARSTFFNELYEIGYIDVKENDINKDIEFKVNSKREKSIKPGKTKRWTI